ncbi:MAG: DEAD/DEAH box helicase [Chloroflexota bacterium]
MIQQSPAAAPVEPAFSRFFDFPFDPFQVEAIQHIRDGRSVMVAAPTSSGKTVVAEYGLWQALQRGSRAIYTTPIKALSNQKRKDLEELFPGRVGLLTGDRSEHPDAPIVVMTTEVLRNMLVEDASGLDGVSMVVFDEVHYLADPERGTVWEEAIITCPGQVRLICLSATIANAREIADWISATHREISLVQHDERPVPLEHYYFSSHGFHLLHHGDGDRSDGLWFDRKEPPPHPADVIHALHQHRLLPAIWFAFARQAVEDAAEACAEASPQPNRATCQRIEEAMTRALDSLPKEDRKLSQLTVLMALLRRGVGFHHAGLLPPLKELVETLFTDGLLSVVCATDTLAIGINMPARTVVISTMARPLGGLLTPNDFRQLTGRAGRRGIDERGAVVMLPGRSYRFEEAYRQVNAELQPISSTFRLRYSTMLSTLEQGTDRLEALIGSSLRQFQLHAEASRKERQIEVLRAALSWEADPGILEYLQLRRELSGAEAEQKRARAARTKNPRGPGMVRRHQRAKAERERLVRAVRTHPQHGEALATESHDPVRMAQLRELSAHLHDVETAAESRDLEAHRTAEAVRNVLQLLGYIGKRGQNRKARGLREMVAAPGIVLSEIYLAGAFNGLAAPELAEVVSWFASDAKRRRYNSYQLPKKLTRIQREAIRTFRKIKNIEEAERIDLAQGPSDWFHGVALDWCRGSSVGEIADRIEMGEGDIVGTLNKTVDLLDQLQSMLTHYDDERLLSIIIQARRLLVRGLVAMVRGNSGDQMENPMSLLHPDLHLPTV